MNPKVSIVIPVYNGSNYMREAIDSALNQTYENCEVIVVNDGSRDEGLTEEIALSYGDRITYYYKENGGVATAINLGIEKMTGEYFAWLSHDDVFYPEKIEKQIKAVLASGDETAICHGNFDFLYMDDKRYVPINFLEQYEKEWLENSNFAPIFLCIHGSTVLIHKSHFERVGNYREDLRATQDSEFLFRVMRGQKSVFISDSLIVGRIHREQGQQTMSCHKPEYNQMIKDFCEGLTKEEKADFCGTEANFYYQMYILMKGDCPADSVLPYLKNKILQVYSEENIFKSTFMDGIKNEKEVYIFGAGNLGKEAEALLTSYGVEVNGYIDNSKEKIGTIINHIQCYGIDELTDKNVCIVVAMMDTMEVENQLHTLGFKNILTYSYIKKVTFKELPTMLRFEEENYEVEK